MKTTHGFSSVLCSVVATVLAAGAARSYGQGATLVVGPSEASSNLDGNSSLIAPFAGAASGRFQQVYSSSLFSAELPPGGGDIVAFSFRVDAELGDTFGMVVTNLQIGLSTTLRSPDGLSLAFSDNVGADESVVKGPGSIGVTGVGGGGFTGFNVDFVFTDRPFHYDPANGNLLVDFQIFAGGADPVGASVLDAFNVVGDSVSSVLGRGPTGTLPVSGQAGSLGLATAFAVYPVPEPSVLALLCVGLGGLGAAWCWRGNGLLRKGVIYRETCRPSSHATAPPQ